jgi:hypothetical protein
MGPMTPDGAFPDDYWPVLPGAIPAKGVASNMFVSSSSHILARAS